MKMDDLTWHSHDLGQLHFYPFLANIPRRLMILMPSFMAQARWTPGTPGTRPVPSTFFPGGDPALEAEDCAESPRMRGDGIGITKDGI